MGSIITDFHIDYHLLLAQTFNFALVVSVLYFFAFKPIVKMMAERTEKIDQGLKDAETSRQKLAESEATSQAVIKESKKQADSIIVAASKQAEEFQKKSALTAKEKVRLIIAEERDKFVAEQDASWQEFKREAGGLAVDLAEKVLSQKMDKKNDADFISKIIK